METISIKHIRKFFLTRNWVQHHHHTDTGITKAIPDLLKILRKFLIFLNSRSNGIKINNLFISLNLRATNGYPSAREVRLHVITYYYMSYIRLYNSV